jgi:TolB-like protein
VYRMGAEKKDQLADFGDAEPVLAASPSIFDDVKKVGEELGVRYVLDGSVRKSGHRVRVTAQLIRADINHHIMAER